MSLRRGPLLSLTPAAARPPLRTWLVMTCLSCGAAMACRSRSGRSSLSARKPSRAAGRRSQQGHGVSDPYLLSCLPSARGDQDDHLGRLEKH